MGVVGSLPVSTSTLQLNNDSNSDTKMEHSLPSPGGSSNETISVIPDVVNKNHTKIHRHCPYHHNSSVTRDSANVKKHEIVDSKLETERETKPESQEAMKHEVRRRKSHETVRKLKSKSDNLRQQLEKQIHELELRQNNLLSDVNKLHSYKQQLEVKCYQTNSNKLIQ
jgi:hypothetical protein